MKRFTILCAAFAVCLAAAQPVFAGNGDRSVYSSSYVDSEGNKGVVMTNRSAQDLNRTIMRQSQDGRYVYRNYTRLSPARGSSPSSSGSTGTLRAPYSHYDPSFVANAHKIMEPIIVSCPGLGNVDITPIIIKEAREHNIDPHLIKTVIKFESGFCASALSPAGACGLMQLMPDTASSLGVYDVFSPYDNIAGGVRYIRRQLDNFNNNVAFALAAYNAGPGAVMDYGGIPPYEETQNYVRNIMADYLAGGRVARRLSLPSPSEKTEPGRKIDMLSTLSRMRCAGSGTPVTVTNTAVQGAPAQSAPELIPISAGQKASTGLLENRPVIQGNPLENRPSAAVPGY